MKRTLFFAAILAIAARVTVFAESGTTGAFVSFALFWVCAAGVVVAELTS